MQAYHRGEWDEVLSSQEFVQFMLNMFRTICVQTSWNPSLFGKIVFDALFTVKVCSTQSELPRLELLHEPQDYDDLLKMYRTWKMEQKHHLFQDKTRDDVNRARTILGTLSNGAYLHRASVKTYSNFSKGKQKDSALYQFAIFLNSHEFEKKTEEQLGEYNFGFVSVGQEDTEGSRDRDRKGWEIRNAYEQETKFLGQLYLRIERMRENGRQKIEKLRNLDHKIAHEVGKTVRVGRDQYNSTFLEARALRRVEQRAPRNPVRRLNRRKETTTAPKIDELQLALQMLTTYNAKTMEMKVIKQKSGMNVKRYILQPTAKFIEKHNLQRDPPDVPWPRPNMYSDDMDVLSGQPFLPTQIPLLRVAEGPGFPEWEDDAGSSDYAVVVVDNPVIETERGFTSNSLEGSLKEAVDLALEDVSESNFDWTLLAGLEPRRESARAKFILEVAWKVFLEACVVTGMRAADVDNPETIVEEWVQDIDCGMSCAAHVIMLVFGLHRFSNSVAIDLDETCRDIFGRSWQFLFERIQPLAESANCEEEKFFHQCMTYMLGEDSMAKASGELRFLENPPRDWSTDRWQSWVDELRSNGHSRIGPEEQVDQIVQYLLRHGLSIYCANAQSNTLWLQFGHSWRNTCFALQRARVPLLSNGRRKGMDDCRSSKRNWD